MGGVRGSGKEFEGYGPNEFDERRNLQPSPDSVISDKPGRELEMYRKVRDWVSSQTRDNGWAE